MSDGFLVFAWKRVHANLAEPSGYGLKISHADKAQHFQSAWKKISLRLPNGRVATCNVDTNFFWAKSDRV